MTHAQTDTLDPVVERFAVWNGRLGALSGVLSRTTGEGRTALEMIPVLEAIEQQLDLLSLDYDRLEPHLLPDQPDLRAMLTVECRASLTASRIALCKALTFARKMAGIAPPRAS